MIGQILPTNLFPSTSSSSQEENRIKEESGPPLEGELSIYAQYLHSYFHPKQNLTITPLKGGNSGAKIYKVTANGQEYVLRAFDPSIVWIKERQSDIEATLYAGKLGIAPTVRYVSPDYQVILMDFMSGPTLFDIVPYDKNTLFTLLQTIRKLHESKGSFPKGKTLFEVIREKLTNFSQETRPIAVDRINQVLEKLQAIEEKFANQPLVPCHQDLNDLNILKEKEEFKLIDWEDSGMSYAYLDLGYFALMNRIQESQYPEFLSLYLGRSPTDEELTLFKDAKDVAILKLFVMNFFHFQPPIQDSLQRRQRCAEFEQMLNDPSHPSLDYFSDLYRKGLLKDKEQMVSLSMSALRTFLKL